MRIRKARAKQSERIDVRMNEGIKSPELRVIGDNGESYGVITRDEAIHKARELGLDLIEISDKATPPVAKITDYGKYLYEYKKKLKETKAKVKAGITETKSVQVKIGTGDHDKQLKAKRAAEWLGQGHRVKVDLFLWGRYKYMEFDFLKERLENFLGMIPEGFKIADEIKKSPKGLTTVLERDASKKRSATPDPEMAAE